MQTSRAPTITELSLNFARLPGESGLSGPSFAGNGECILSSKGAGAGADTGVEGNAAPAPSFELPAPPEGSASEFTGSAAGAAEQANLPLGGLRARNFP